MAQRCGTQYLSDEQHEVLLKSAVQVDHLEGHKEPEGHNRLVTQTVKRKIHVPVEKEVKVPVVTKKVDVRMEKQIVEGTKMVPIKKYRDVTETVLETKEEVVHGFKERWVKVKEPTTETVKKQVPVTRTRRISYIDYVEQKVQKTVEVPKDFVTEVHGFRVDKHIGTKVVEVEEDVQYEMRPVIVKKGERRVRETGDVHHVGKMVHGTKLVLDGGRSAGETEWSNAVRGDQITVMNTKGSAGETEWSSAVRGDHITVLNNNGQSEPSPWLNVSSTTVQRNAAVGTCGGAQLGSQWAKWGAQTSTRSAAKTGEEMPISESEWKGLQIGSGFAVQGDQTAWKSLDTSAQRSAFETVETPWTTSSSAIRTHSAPPLASSA